MMSLLKREKHAQGVGVNMSEESFDSALGARHARKLVGMMLALCIISAAAAGSSMFLLTPRLSQSVYAEQSLHLESSYTIWRNGSTYYAEDAYGLPWGEGSNASMIINNALSGLTSGRTWKEKILIVGNIEITNPLIVHSYTILQLDGQITLANNANTDLVKSYGFDNLTGKNSTDGGVQDVEFTGGVYDGNRANNNGSGCGFQLYGKRYTLDNIEVRNCGSDGIYSEWANAADVGSPTDAMESMWVNVRSCFNNGNGITMRGPHDSVVVNTLTYCNNGNGTSIEGTSVYTGGGLQLVNFHSYGNHGDGIWSNEYFLGSSIQSESNDGRGVYILHNDVHLSALHIYNNRGGCAIEIGNDTYGPSGVMIEAKTLGNNCSLRLTNGAGNSYTITCWENVTVIGTLSDSDEYNIFNTKNGDRYKSSDVSATVALWNQCWFWPMTAAILAIVIIVAYSLWRRRTKKTNLA